MSYSCSDFADTILDALKIDVPEESADSPSDQADLALAEIAKLRAAAAELTIIKAGAPLAPIPPVVYVTYISHRHGDGCEAFATEAAAIASLAAYCREWWHEARVDDDVAPADDRECIEVYFDRAEDENGAWEACQISGAPADITKAARGMLAALKAFADVAEDDDRYPHFTTEARKAIAAAEAAGISAGEG